MRYREVEHNYPIRIDTKTLQEDEPVPDPQYIGFETKVTQSFRAHRVISGGWILRLFLYRQAPV